MGISTEVDHILLKSYSRELRRRSVQAGSLSLFPSSGKTLFSAVASESEAVGELPWLLLQCVVPCELRNLGKNYVQPAVSCVGV